MRADRIWGGVILLFGSVYLLEGIRIPEAAIGDPLGPRIFPSVLGGIMLACGSVLLFRPAGRDAPVLQRRFFAPVLLLTGVLMAYALSLFWLGYPLATFLFLVIASRMMGERSVSWSLAIAMPFSLAMFFLFTRVLAIPLPPGLLRLVGFE